MENEKKSYKILFIDDDSFIQEMYSIKFAERGHDARFAANGKEAIKILKEGFKPDVVVFDLIMPTMSGFEFLSNAKKENLLDGIKLVALTNQGEREDLARAKQYKVDSYIIKANHIPSEVVALIENAMQSDKKEQL